MFFMPVYELKETKQFSSQRSQQSSIHFPIISAPVMIIHHHVNYEKHYLEEKKKKRWLKKIIKAQVVAKDNLDNT